MRTVTVTITRDHEMFPVLRREISSRGQSFPNGSNYICSYYFPKNLDKSTQFGRLITSTVDTMFLSGSGVLPCSKTDCFLIDQANNWHLVEWIDGGRGAGTDLGAHFCNQDQVTLKAFRLTRLGMPQIRSNGKRPYIHSRTDDYARYFRHGLWRPVFLNAPDENAFWMNYLTAETRNNELRRAQ